MTFCFSYKTKILVFFSVVVFSIVIEIENCTSKVL